MSFVKPALPGTVISFIGQRAPRIEPSAADTVAIPLVHDWGPVATDPVGTTRVEGGPQLMEDFAAFTSMYGDSDTAGRTAVAEAFAGSLDSPGAGSVYVARMAGASATKATITINAVGAGAPTLRLDGRYVGSRGNRISYQVDSDPNNTAQDRIRIFFDGVLQETYYYLAPNLAAAAAAINKLSQLVRATALVLDAAPALRLMQNANPTLLAAGDDGATVLSTDHLNALAALQFKRFGIIAPYDLTDSAIQTSYKAWVQSQAAASAPCRLVIGGAAGESLATALTRSASMGDEHVLNFGCGTYHDDLLGKDLSTSQLAPRIAGILAGKGQSRSLTFTKIGGLHVVVGVDVDQLALAVTGGVVVLAPVSADDADVRIEKGVTTYTLDSLTKPFDVYSDARLIGIMDNYVRDMKEWGDDNVIGDLPVNDDTRAEVRGKARRLEAALLRAGLILPGDDITIPKPWVKVDPPTDPNLADTIPYTFGWQFARTANAIMGQGTIL